MKTTKLFIFYIFITCVTAGDIQCSIKDLVELKIAELSNINVFGGLKKYDKDTYEPLPYPGYTVIYNVPHSNYSYLHLDQVQDKIIEPFNEIFNKTEKPFAWVNPEYYHMTTFDLITAASNKSFPDLETFEKVYMSVAKYTKEYMESIDCRQKLPGKLVGIRTSGCKMMLVNVHFSKEVKEKIIKFRTGLHDYLLENLEDYKYVHKNNSFHPHITLAYGLRVPRMTKWKKYLKWMETSSKLFEGIEVEFDLGDLMYFTNMDHYIHI